MAEWIGHLMTGWPTWLIGVAVLVMLIIGFYWSAGYGGIVPDMWRKRHAKK